MRIFNVRFGLATNSSSKHSLVFLAENSQVQDHQGYDEPNFGETFGDFGWNHFTIVSPAVKMRYLAALLKERLYEELPQNIADVVIRSWLPDVYFEEDDGIDHQSYMCLPSAHGTRIPDEQFFNELKAYLLQDKLAILGGNDNEYAVHYLDNGDTFWLPVPTDTSMYWSNYICRFDEQYKYWTVFCVKDGTKIRFRFDAAPNEMSLKPEKASAPELVDLKITDFCPYGCQYCYQDSSAQGKHADQYTVSTLARQLAYLKVFEVAIGGGEPTFHPDFVSILQHFREVGIVPNFTTRNIGWLREPEKARKIIEACGAFGYSVSSYQQVHELKTLLDYNGFDMKPNIHVVLGVVDSYGLAQILKATADCGFATTLLGYKQVGRGAGFRPERIGDWIQVVKRATERRPYGADIGIDTPLAAEFEEGLINQNVDPRLYETKEGGFSCYIDAVEEKMGPSSYCKPEEMMSISRGDWRDPDNREIYQKIQDVFATF